jgi:hypothetical protein
MSSEVNNVRDLSAGHHGGGAGSALVWVKSSLSYANGDCVEVANLPDGCIGVRDSKDAEGPILRFTSSEWRAFISGVHNGEFDN